MSFVTYAQNFEDVMLWRALRTVERGFYIDVGAHDARIDSVTAAFYERNWRGINIEPVADFHAGLVRDRPEDLNLRVGIGRGAGTATLHVVAETGLSTFYPAIAERHYRRGHAGHTETIEILPLAEICRRHVAGPIHFLKIDVEGAERDVLAGADFATYRPWIVLLEATAPNSQVPTHEEWEPLILAAGYRFVWFDGLNRFYVAVEKMGQLGNAFRAPPNVFDSVKLTPRHYFYPQPPPVVAPVDPPEPGPAPDQADGVKS